MRSALILAFFCACSGCCGPRAIVTGSRHDQQEVRRSIEVGVQRAVVHPDQRIMPASRIVIHDAPFDMALEVVWLEFSDEALGVIWARRGEDSSFLPVRMFLPPNYPIAPPASMPVWPPRELRTVDVLLRSSRSALDHAEMADAWTGSILIEDVPLEWATIMP